MTKSSPIRWFLNRYHPFVFLKVTLQELTYLSSCFELAFLANRKSCLLRYVFFLCQVLGEGHSAIDTWEMGLVELLYCDRKDAAKLLVSGKNEKYSPGTFCGTCLVACPKPVLLLAFYGASEIGQDKLASIPSLVHSTFNSCLCLVNGPEQSADVDVYEESIRRLLSMHQKE